MLGAIATLDAWWKSWVEESEGDNLVELELFFPEMVSSCIQLKRVNSFCRASRICHVANLCCTDGLATSWWLFDDSLIPCLRGGFCCTWPWLLLGLWGDYGQSTCVPVWPHVCWILSLVCPITYVSIYSIYIIHTYIPRLHKSYCWFAVLHPTIFHHLTSKRGGWRAEEELWAGGHCAVDLDAWTIQRWSTEGIPRAGVDMVGDLQDPKMIR